MVSTTTLAPCKAPIRVPTRGGTQRSRQGPKKSAIFTRTAITPPPTPRRERLSGPAIRNGTNSTATVFPGQISAHINLTGQACRATRDTWARPAAHSGNTTQPRVPTRNYEAAVLATKSDGSDNGVSLDNELFSRDQIAG